MSALLGCYFFKYEKNFRIKVLEDFMGNIFCFKILSICKWLYNILSNKEQPQFSVVSSCELSCGLWQNTTAGWSRQWHKFVGQNYLGEPKTQQTSNSDLLQNTKTPSIWQEEINDQTPKHANESKTSNWERWIEYGLAKIATHN